jgi:hypothetical protein
MKIATVMRVTDASIACLLLSSCAEVPYTGPGADGSPAPPPGVIIAPTPQPSQLFSAAGFVEPSGCPRGSIYDRRNGGECWSCPTGSVQEKGHPITANNACEVPAKTHHSRFVDKHAATGLIKTDCRSGFFLHQLSGVCYRCPSGYKRTTAGIDTPQACVKHDDAKPLRANFVKRVGCQAPAFYDPRNGGECWRCPDGFTPTGASATDGRACRR